MGMLKGKVAAITGAGRGIGRGEALLFAEHGAKVVVNDLGGEWDGTGADPRAASQVVEEIRAAGGEAEPHFEDISEPEGAASLIETALDAFGRLDVVVNNAGILRDRMLFNMSVEEWDSVIKVHLRGHFLVSREACAHWRERSKSGDGPSAAIVNTTSTSGILGMIGQSNYGAAKAGIASLTQITAMEMQRYGGRCNAIAPGARTRMTEQTFRDLPPVAEGEWDPIGPDNVAPLAVFLAGDAAAGITGQVIGIAGGVIELFHPWHPVTELVQDRRWTPEEIAEHVDELFAGQPREYRPPTTTFRKASGLAGAREG